MIAVPLLAVLSLLQTTVLRQIPFLDGNLDLLLLAVAVLEPAAPGGGHDLGAGGGILLPIFSPAARSA